MYGYAYHNSCSRDPYCPLISACRTAAISRSLVFGKISSCTQDLLHAKSVVEQQELRNFGTEFSRILAFEKSTGGLLG